MKAPFTFGILLVASALSPGDAFAQTEDVGVTVLGLVSIQPTDDYYGGPYLSQGLGGVGPGWGVGASRIAPGGFVVSGEFTTAQFQMEQSGRLISGAGPNEGAVRTSRLHDSMVGLLLGYADSAGPTRLVWLGGLSLILGSATVDSRSQEDGGLFGFTGGFDVHQALARRTALTIGLRYTRVHGRPQRSLGIGPNILRAGIGIRIRTN